MTKAHSIGLLVILALVLAALPPAAVVAQASGGLPPDVEVVHIVGPGESIADIANAYGLSPSDLVAANGLLDTQWLRVGQFLRVPLTAALPTPAAQAKYVVQAGDTLSRIAARYGTTVEAIAALNGIADTSMIQEGQPLSIPGAPTATEITLRSVRSLTVSPSPAPQGRTVSIVAVVDGDRRVTATLGGDSLAVTREGARAWAIQPIAPWAPLGERMLILTAQAPGASGVRVSCPVAIVSGEFPVEILEIPEDRQSLLDPAVNASENSLLAQVYSVTTTTRLWDGLFVQPAEGEITSVFGTRRSYDGEDPESYHMGTDLGAAEGSPVVAANAGRVVFAQATNVRGNMVVIDHGLGLLTAYFHMSRIEVQVGQTVTKGAQIGLVGNTGLSTGAHLHWEMRLAGVPVNAFQWTTQTIP